jgi:hypothetical protein
MSDQAAKIETRDRVDEQVDQLLTGLQLYGFAVVKEIAALRGRKRGHMGCPLCGHQLWFSTAACNGHFAARCAREGCLNAME